MKVNGREILNERGLRETLDTMYALAKAKKEPFYNLIDLMCNEQTIMSAIHNIKSNKGSMTAGIDGKTIVHFLQMPYSRLIAIVRREILNYRPRPVRRKYIPKAGSSKMRPLGIPVMIDRIIQEVTRMVIEPIAEAKFYQYSFGFRPMRDASQAMAEIIERIRRNGTYWVIEGDIMGFFDNIDHNKLISMLWNIGIKDKRVLAIIKKMLKAGVMEEDGRLLKSDVGSPQGGIISPLLANIYLNAFDWMIAHKFVEHPARYTVPDPSKKGLTKVRKRHTDIFLIRYADDWVILCKSKHQAESVLSQVEKYFKHCLKLELSREKTLITDIRKQRAKFLGFEIFAEKSRSPGSEQVVGKFIPNIAKSTEKVREIGREIRHLNILLRNKRDLRDAALQIEKVNSKIVGLTNYYSYANCSNFFKSWDKRIVYQTYKVFSNTKCRFYAGLKRDWMCKAKDSGNRKNRHENRSDMIFAVPVDGIWIGVTKFSFTPSQTALKVNLALTPYSKEGRRLHHQKTGSLLPLLRMGTIYSYNELLERVIWMKTSDRGSHYYNFEFVMNREYAYLRDKGKCKCCDQPVLPGNYDCHHINPSLPVMIVNKVNNLATLCSRCHGLIHDDNLDPNALVERKAAAKVIRYRERLSKQET
ncbi:group II intron reverse transcriptase/maturase [Cohnella phaseoli]|uniref:Group II intron reverse transcriptase/maturase n=1 Tax=Cohnella phaseoli TaxID=456490 RepID=A0A3D9JPA6_9BACL|nr:group II intron reverse transcriptase/maturase [Cohnella phaseoli]RED75943.1 group II intron reverse transcriptase/maturase [Cohnella phaseoli]